VVGCAAHPRLSSASIERLFKLPSLYHDSLHDRFTDQPPTPIPHLKAEFKLFPHQRRTVEFCIQKEALQRSGVQAAAGGSASAASSAASSSAGADSKSALSASDAERYYGLWMCRMTRGTPPHPFWYNRGTGQLCTDTPPPLVVRKGVIGDEMVFGGVGVGVGGGVEGLCSHLLLGF
jgi:hypothetical protein